MTLGVPLEWWCVTSCGATRHAVAAASACVEILGPDYVDGGGGSAAAVARQLRRYPVSDYDPQTISLFSESSTQLFYTHQGRYTAIIGNNIVHVL